MFYWFMMGFTSGSCISIWHGPLGWELQQFDGRHRQVMHLYTGDWWKNQEKTSQKMSLANTWKHEKHVYIQTKYVPKHQPAQLFMWNITVL